MNGKQILNQLWLVVQAVGIKLKLGRLKMKTHNKFIEEVKELTKQPTLPEKTHDALKGNKFGKRQK